MEKKKKEESLLVYNVKKNDLQVVKGYNKDGNIVTLPPKKEHKANFININKQDDMLENFFKNLAKEFRDPTKFEFFRIESDAVEKVTPQIQDIIDRGDANEYYEKLGGTIINAKDYETVAETQGYKPIDENKIDWEALEKCGITRETLAKDGSLEEMLNYRKSKGLGPINANLGEITIKADARLSFKENPDGSIMVNLHCIKKMPELEKPFFGHTFTPEEKTTLLTKGNLGEIIHVKLPNSDDKIPVYVSVDRQTNDLVAYQVSKIRIPDELKGVTLTADQKEVLKEGKELLVEDMTSSAGKRFSARIQINADKRGIEFIFDKSTKKEQAKELVIQDKILGVSISKEQKEALKEGEAVYIEGMTGKRGNKFNSFLKVNKEAKIIEFLGDKPDKKESQEAKKRERRTNGQRL